MGRRRGRVASDIRNIRYASRVAGILALIVFGLFACDNELGDLLGSAEIRLKYGTTEILINDTFDFSEVQANEISDVFTFVIENGGKSDLTLPSGIKLTGTDSGMFVVMTQPTAAVLAPGESATFELRFEPTGAAGAKSATVTIDTNDAAIGTFVFTLTGTCVTDTTPPSVVISSSEGDYTTLSTIPITITFSEYVNGFSVTDVNVNIGTAANLDAAANPVFTMNITDPVPDPAVITVDIAANVSQDLAGNDNTAAEQFTITYTTDVPLVSISTEDGANPTNANPIVFVFTFSEPVTDFIATDVVITNGDPGSLETADDLIFTLPVVPDDDLTVIAEVGDNVASSIASGYGNIAASPFAVIYDSTSPSVTIDSDVGLFTSEPSVPLTITFSEPVSGFTVDDIDYTGASLGTLDTVDFTEFTITVTAPGDSSAITVDIAADAVTDAAGNGNTVAEQLAVTYNANLPTVDIDSMESSPTKLVPIAIDILFSEPVLGLDLLDIVVGNGDPGNLQGTGATYSVDVTAVGDGDVTVDIGAGAVLSVADSLPNSAAGQFVIEFDGTPPEVSITSAVTGPTGASSIPITLTFTEVVTGFDIGDMTVSNGELGGFMDEGGGVYTAAISTASSSNGTIAVDIDADAAFDAALNGNTAATQFTIEYDDSIIVIAELYYLDGAAWNADLSPPDGTISVAADGNDMIALNVDGGIYALDSSWVLDSIGAPTGCIDLTYLDGVLYGLTAAGTIEFLNGAAWSALSAGAPAGTIDIAGSGGALFALTDTGDVFNLDGGSWTDINASFAGALAITDSGGSLHLLSDTLAIFELAGKWETTNATAPDGSVDLTSMDGTIFVLVN